MLLTVIISKSIITLYTLNNFDKYQIYLNKYNKYLLNQNMFYSLNICINCEAKEPVKIEKIKLKLNIETHCKTKSHFPGQPSISYKS